jgi:hypothetical protein
MVWHSYYRAQIEEKQSQKKNSQAQDSTFCSHGRPYQATYLGCKEHFQVQRLTKKDPQEMSHHLHQSQRCVVMTYP